MAEAADTFDTLHRESTSQAERLTKVINRGGVDCEQGEGYRIGTCSPALSP